MADPLEYAQWSGPLSRVSPGWGEKNVGSAPVRPEIRLAALPEAGQGAPVTLQDLLLRPERYPRSSRYDPAWVLDLDMGPHPLWQLEDLLHGVELEPGGRVLDLGAGMGATSVYLAREYDVRVDSLDLWVEVAERQPVLDDAGVAELVTAMQADVRTADLPESTYDAVVCVDAFEYLGTDVHLLPRLVKTLRPSGLLAISTPALRHDPYDAGIPPYLREIFGWEIAAWHAPDWWRRHWELSGLVGAVDARWQEGGRGNWQRWQTALREASGETGPDRVLDMLEADIEEEVGFALVTATRR